MSAHSNHQQAGSKPLSLRRNRLLALEPRYLFDGVALTDAVIVPPYVDSAPVSVETITLVSAVQTDSTAAPVSSTAVAPDTATQSAAVTPATTDSTATIDVSTSAVTDTKATTSPSSQRAIWARSSIDSTSASV